MISGQHSTGGTEQLGTALVLVLKVQAGSALKVAVSALAKLFALSFTPAKVCEVAEVVDPTATVVTLLPLCRATPLSTKLPLAGLFSKVAVTLAVK